MSNISERNERTIKIIGEEKLCKLTQAKILLFGVGGVGSYVCEALVRSGVGSIDIVDNDTVCESNINRQLIATYDTLGSKKVEVAKGRMLSINPMCKVKMYDEFYLPDSDLAKELDFSQYDYVVDAIDTISAKIHIISTCKTLGVPIISSMGTGNKLDNTKFKIVDIKKTTVCPLAKVVRKELKTRGIEGVEVLYSEEEPIKTTHGPGSISYVPATAGLLIAGHVINNLIK